LKARAKPYINAVIFLEDIRTVHLPNLNELRRLEEFSDEDAVLLMDNCPSHVGKEIFNLLRDVRVRIMTWAPYTTRTCQKLDICLFGVLKRRGRYTLPFDDDRRTTGFLLKIYWTFKQTMIGPDI
jgi:hypothetical protein